MTTVPDPIVEAPPTVKFTVLNSILFVPEVMKVPDSVVDEAKVMVPADLLTNTFTKAVCPEEVALTPPE